VLREKGGILVSQKKHSPEGGTEIGQGRADRRSKGMREKKTSCKSEAGREEGGRPLKKEFGKKKGKNGKCQFEKGRS